MVFFSKLFKRKDKDKALNPESYMKLASFKMAAANYQYKPKKFANGVLFLNKLDIIFKSNEKDKFKPDIVILRKDIISAESKNKKLTIKTKDKEFSFKMAEADEWQKLVEK